MEVDIIQCNGERFLSDPGIPGIRSMGPSLSKKQTNQLYLCVNLTDVTLAGEDTNSIQY